MSSIRNPYAKGSATLAEPFPKKRYERPWERSIYRSATTEERQQQEDPFDDSGIDWNEAGRVIDTAIQNGQNGKQYLEVMTDSQKNMPSPTGRSIHSIHIPKASSSSKSVASLTVSPTTRQLPKPSNRHPDQSRPELCGLTQPYPSYQHKMQHELSIQSKRDVVSSIRPESWKEQMKPIPSMRSKSDVVAPIRPESWKEQMKAIPSIRSNDRRKDIEIVLQENVDPILKSLPQKLQFDIQTVQQPVADQYRAVLIQNAAVSQPLINGWTLFAHQKRAIVTAIKMRRMILALEMGLGKTLIGCCWARAFCRTFEQDNLRVIVLCPVSLKEEWRRTMIEAVGLTVQDDDINIKKKKAKNDVTKMEEESANVILASWAKIPDVLPDNQKYIVIADEAHSMQSMSATRTQDALKLMLAPNAIGVLLLTGTPMKNGKPSNLFPLLKAVKHPFGSHQRAYEGHFCEGRDIYFSSRTVWQAIGAANLEQLHTLTKSHMLYLTKAECLTLPKQVRITKTVPVSSRALRQHAQALDKLAKIYSSESTSRPEALLGAVQSLRMVDSLAKVDATVQTCREILKKEPAVVVFTDFVAVAKSVHAKLSDAGWTGELLTGETPPKKRQGLVDAFQNGLSPVFVSTFGAGGVGLTLTAACTIVLVDRPWTPGDARQAEDRVHRIGQTKEVTSIWMSAFPLDEQIDAMIEHKSQTSMAVLTSAGTMSTTEYSDGAKLSILKLLQNVLPHAKQTSAFKIK